MGVPEPNRTWFKCKETEKELPPGQEGKTTARSTIMYSFYSKPMANLLTILKRSAMPEGTKVATVTAEIMRRW